MRTRGARARGRRCAHRRPVVTDDYANLTYYGFPYSLGDLTDLFGERIVYRREPLADDTSGHLNACGVVASSAAFAQTHRAVCDAMRGNAEAAGRLQPWGLADPAVTVSSRAEVDRVLRARRSRLLGGCW